MKSYLLEKRFDDEYEAENAATEFIDFCKGRAWVLTDIGSELYGFTHRTFLEYFAASQIVRLNPDPTKLFTYLEKRLKGGGWEVVAQLALQIINKTVEDGADDFLEVLLKKVETLDDARLKTVHLAFSTQALTYIVPRPPVLRSIVQSAITMFCGQSATAGRRPDKLGGPINTRSPIYMLLGASPENLPLVSKYTYDYLAEVLQDRPHDQAALALALYTDVYSASNILEDSGYRGTRNNAGFWHEQAESNWERFIESIELQRTSHPWVETYFLERGRTTVGDFLAKFAVRELYERKRTNTPEGLILPLVPRIWLSQAGPQEHSGETSQVSEDQIDELRVALLQKRTPWFAQEETIRLHGIVSYVMDRISTQSENQGPITSFLFFGATMIDYTGQSVNETRGRRDLGNEWPKELARIWRLRQTARSVDGEAERERLMRIGVDDATAEVLARWITDREFYFIRPKIRRSRQVRPL
jgi:hypothetical protein